MNAPRHLYLDKTGTRLVAEDHPDAAEQLAAPGQPISAKRLRAAGLTLDDVREHVAQDEKAEQTAESAAPEGEEDPLVTLLKMTRAELNDCAANCGVNDADALPNKEAVANAIIAAQQGGE